METKLEKQLLDKIDNLPSGSEDKNKLFDSLETELLTKINNSADDVIRFALFESLPPIEDYSFAIKVMKEHYTKYNDFRIAVLVSYWSSAWESYKENDFIPVLDAFLESATWEEKSIIYYLKAYDLFVRRSENVNLNYYKKLLEKSIYYNDKSFYNYYDLCLVSKKNMQRKSLKKEC